MKPTKHSEISGGACCFFCGESIKKAYRRPSRKSNRNKLTTTNIHDNPQIQTWDKQCAASLCKVLRFPPDDLSTSILMEIDFQAQSCSCCLQLARDIDFSLGSIVKLQQKILHLRQMMFKKVTNKLEVVLQEISQMSKRNITESSSDLNDKFFVVTDSKLA